jgi:hypothetical protein
MLDAGMAMRRSIEIDQPSWLEKPTDFDGGYLLTANHKNLGLIVCAAGQVDERLQAARQSVDIYNQLWSADSTHAQAGDDPGTAGSLPYVPEGVYRVQIGCCFAYRLCPRHR